MATDTILHNITPGEILLKDFLEPMGISQNKLARELSVPAPRINTIVLGKRAITSDTALRLARFFGTTPDFWLGLQQEYELRRNRRLLGKRIQKEVHPLALATT